MTDTLNIITDADIAVLNAARSILDRVQQEHGFAAQAGIVRAATYAEAAEHALFKFINVTHAYTHRALTYEQLHNRLRPVAGETRVPA